MWSITKPVPIFKKFFLDVAWFLGLESGKVPFKFDSHKPIREFLECKKTISNCPNNMKFTPRSYLLLYLFYSQINIFLFCLETDILILVLFMLIIGWSTEYNGDLTCRFLKLISHPVTFGVRHLTHNTKLSWPSNHWELCNADLNKLSLLNSVDKTSNGALFFSPYPENPTYEFIELERNIWAVSIEICCFVMINAWSVMIVLYTNHHSNPKEHMSQHTLFLSHVKLLTTTVL